MPAQKDPSDGIPSRARTRAGSFLAALSVVLLAFVVADHAYFCPRLGIRRVPGLGNFEENASALPPTHGGSFRFAVLGDSAGYREVYEELMRRAHELGAVFVVFTGDLVYRPYREAFELFNHDFQSLGAAALPTFVAAGNHEDRGLALFREHCGPENFSFVYEGCLFVFGDNNRLHKLPACAAYVAGEIARHRGAVERVFITLHHPIIDYRRKNGVSRDRARNPAMHRILAEEEVDAVFMGHYHGYVREQSDETLMLITGGAGARFHDESGFYHMILIDVAPDGIRDTLVRIEKTERSLLDSLRLEFLEVHVRMLGTWWGSLISVAGAVFIFLLGRRISKGPRGGRGRSGG